MNGPESGIPHVVGNYILKRQIGKGSFATVWRAEHKLAKLPVAIKVIANSSLSTEDSQTRFVREVNLIKQMDHPFIAKLFEVIKTEEYTYLVMEFAENGSILTYVNSHGRLPEKQARRYFSQLISALEYLHDEKKVAHRDLKAENVLLDRNLNIRLIDFGLSNSFTEEAPELTTACGSPAYASPEMVRGQPYTKAADVWSAGVLLYAMVTGQLPFDDDNMQRLLQKIAFTEPQFPAYLSPQLVDLLRKVMMKNPDVRATIPKIKSHPWFSQSEYSQFLELQFSTDDQWLVAGVDKELVNQISSMGVDVKSLTQSLICGEYNELTAIYWILRRNQITDKIKEMMEHMNETTVTKGNLARQGSTSVMGNVSQEAGERSIPRPGSRPVPIPIPKAREGTAVASGKPPVPVPAGGARPGIPKPAKPGQKVPIPVPSGKAAEHNEAAPVKVPVPGRVATPQKGIVKRGRVNSLVVK